MYFGRDVLQRSTFAEVGILMIPVSIFRDFGGLGINLHVDLGLLWCANLLFGMLSGLTLASWEALGRSWDTGEHDKGDFEVQLCIFTIFLDLGTPC